MYQRVIKIINTYSLNIRVCVCVCVCVCVYACMHTHTQTYKAKIDRSEGSNRQQYNNSTRLQ